MRLKENIHTWQIFAKLCEGGSGRARALILSACQILREHHDSEDRARCYDTDSRFDELKHELKRIGSTIGLDSSDARTCSTWILGACLCVIQGKGTEKNDSVQH
ncbi:MAG: hypothetical protein RLZZ342_110 [Candidatus Parcubacteria bacterium]|jgi:hypothetical protein